MKLTTKTTIHIINLMYEDFLKSDLSINLYLNSDSDIYDKIEEYLVVENLYIEFNSDNNDNEVNNIGKLARMLYNKVMLKKDDY